MSRAPTQNKERAIQNELAAIAAGKTLRTVDSTRRQAKAIEAGRGYVPACCGDPDGQYNFIMSGYATKEAQSNWCGPATFQMMDWADDGTKESQAAKADLLGTTSAGTSISSMVSHTNTNTGWDNKAGDYIVQGISSWDTDKFWGTHVAHIGDSTPAPIIEHPEELDQYFSYLSHDGDGHFQVGRGYQLLTGDTTRYIGIFDPWNEADWFTGGNTTWGAHLVATSKMLAATKANSFENIGM